MQLNTPEFQDKVAVAIRNSFKELHGSSIQEALSSLSSSDEQSDISGDTLLPTHQVRDSYATDDAIESQSTNLDLLEQQQQTQEDVSSQVLSALDSSDPKISNHAAVIPSSVIIIPPRSIQESLKTAGETVSVSAVDESKNEGASVAPVILDPRIPGLYVTPEKGEELFIVKETVPQQNLKSHFAKFSALSDDGSFHLDFNSQGFRKDFEAAFQEKFKQIHGSSVQNAFAEITHQEADKDQIRKNERDGIIKTIADLPLQDHQSSIGEIIRGPQVQSHRNSFVSSIGDLPLEDHRSGEASANVGFAVLPEAVPVSCSQSEKYVWINRCEIYWLHFYQQYILWNLRKYNQFFWTKHYLSFNSVLFLRRSTVAVWAIDSATT